MDDEVLDVLKEYIINELKILSFRGPLKEYVTIAVIEFLDKKAKSNELKEKIFQLKKKYASHFPEVIGKEKPE